MIKYFLSITLLLCLFVSCKQIDKSSVKGLITEHAMVVSARAEASEIGSAILKKGGNAFDAMCATQLALAVAYPFAGNIGGGGFMVYRKANGDIGSIDFREKAPLAATKNMYLDELGEVIPNKSILGAMAVGVPGTIAGVFEVHKKLGSLPIEDILEPVINLAYKGVTVTKKQEQKIKKYQPLFLEANKQPIILDTLWKTNDVIKYPELAKTLERILKHGRDEFYKGETAKILAKFIQDNGGIITEEDLAKYKAKWRTPITFTYDDLKIISMAPPASGGICLAQIMTMLQPFHLDEYGHNSLKTIQAITEAERRAYADRSFYLGDSDFVEIPIETLIKDDYLSGRMVDFSFEKATLSSDVSHGNIKIIESNSIL